MNRRITSHGILPALPCRQAGGRQVRIRDFFDYYWKRKDLRRWDALRHLAFSPKETAYSWLVLQSRNPACPALPAGRRKAGTNHETPRKILEIGPGMGEDTEALFHKGYEVYAIDLSRESLLRVKDKITNIKFQIPNHYQYPLSNFQTNFKLPVTHFYAIKMDAHHLGFRDGSFELLFGNTVLMHLDRKRFFREAHRVLQKNGKAVFIEPLKSSPILFFYRTLLSKSRKIHPRYLTLQEIQSFSFYFREVKVLPFYLTSILFLPLLSTQLSFIPHLLFSIDETLLQLFPFLMRVSSIAVIECVK